MEARARRLGRLVLASAMALAGGLAPTSGLAQAIERNLPRSEPRPDAPVITPAPALQDDATPLGPQLSALILLGGADAADLGAPQPRGIDLHRVERLKDTERRFQAFLGRPISRKLISEIEAEILEIHRSQGHPLINISAPPQDINDGVLRIRVMEFKLGSVNIPTGSPLEGKYITDRVHLKPGDVVDTNVLSEDLEWLNRYAFRQITVAFSPSQRPGSADVKLQAESARPWRVSAGYANSGTPQTGLDRYFIAAQARVPGLRDAVASYQSTVSGDVLLDHGQIFHPAPDPLYRSNGLSLIVPTLPRQSLELTLNDIQTNQPFEAFIANSSILEASVGYHSAASGLGLGMPGEFSLGLEARQSVSKIKFDGVVVNDARFDVYQLFLGYAWRGNSRLGAAQVATNVHISPGGVNAHNTDRAFAGYSTNRFTSAEYSYATAGITLLSPSFSTMGIDDLQLYSNLTAQYANKSMPATEQMGLGGASAVRGYTLDDGAFDSGAVLRTELRRRSTSLLRSDDALTSSVFLDVGYGKANYTREEQTAAAIGAGVNYRLAQRLTLSLDVAAPLSDLGGTRSGRARVQSLLAVSF